MEARDKQDRTRSNKLQAPPDAFVTWVAGKEAARSENFRGYAYAIAQARYVIRKILRIVDEQAKRHGLDPLTHQALIQVLGAEDELLTINGIAERLDIAAAFASRLVNQLESNGHVVRKRSSGDRRVTNVEITTSGEELLQAIDRDVHVHVEYFQSQFDEDRRLPALAIFAFYLGIGQETSAGAAIRSSVLDHKIG